MARTSVCLREEDSPDVWIPPQLCIIFHSRATTRDRPYGWISPTITHYALCIMNYHGTHVRVSLRDFGHRNPTPTSLESATLDFVNIGPLDLPTHAEPTRWVVDPLSLATVADSIMISVARPKSSWCRFK